MRHTKRRGKPIDRAAVFGDFGDDGEWYLTVRCASSTCRQLIAFQKALYPGDLPNLRIAIAGEPTVHCPHCRMLMRVKIDEIERRRIVVMQ
jgi:hypothetical protein